MVTSSVTDAVILHAHEHLVSRLCSHLAEAKLPVSHLCEHFFKFCNQDTKKTCPHFRCLGMLQAMTTPPIIDNIQVSSANVQQEVVTTWSLLGADPLVANLAAPYETFYQQKWLPVVARETELLVEDHRADAMVDAADHALDDFVDELDSTLLQIVGKDRSDPLYDYYFGKKRPHEMKRPVLGDELETLRSFVQPLKTSPHGALAALGEKLELLIARADAAVERQRIAAETIKTFRTLGERRAAIDELNALRQSTAGILSEMPHKHPEKRLPADYAARFFKRGPRRGKTAGKDITSADLSALIAEHKQQVETLEKQLAEVLAKEEAEARAKSENEALQAELLAAEKTAAETAARIAALKAKLK